MTERNKDRKRGRHGNRSNRGNRKESHSRELVFDQGETVHIMFQERKDGRTVSCIGLNELNIDIFPQTLRFRPHPTLPTDQEPTPYYCRVQRFHGKNGAEYGLAMPVWPTQLSPDEWLPVNRLHEVFLAELTFRKGYNRMIANHKGRTVLLDRGHKVPLEKKIRCRLEEHGNSIYAIPLLLVEGEESETGGAMVSMKDAFGDMGFSDSSFIVVDVIKAKRGVTPMTKDDIVVSQKYRDAYDILSNARYGIVIDESSTVKDVKDAFNQQAPLVHPDTTLRSFKGRDDAKPPLMMKMLAEAAYKRLTDAKERALTLLEPKKVPVKAEDRREEGAEKTRVTKKKTARKKVVAKKKVIKKKTTSKKKVVKKKAASKKVAATAADDAPASSEVSADATFAEVSTSEPAKKLNGEPETQLKKFERRYGNRDTFAASAKTPKSPKSDTADENAATDKGSMADQLASLKPDLGLAK